MPTNKSGLRGRFWKQVNAPAKGDSCTSPIAMIDMGLIEETTPQGGKTKKHMHFDGKLHKQVSSVTNASKSGHAMEVAGLFATWCSAEIVHYNVWDEDGPGFEAPNYNTLLQALHDIASTPDVCLLSLSIGIEDNQWDQAQMASIEQAVKDCIAAGVIVVAAVGEDGKAIPAFPARVDDVIGVSAVNPYDMPLRKTNKGATVAAPGESVDVMIDKEGYRKQDGSSYAAPFVTAAIWNALCAKGRLSRNLLPTPAEMRSMLESSAREPKGILLKNNGDDEEIALADLVGFGTLIPAKLAANVPAPVLVAAHP